MPRWAVSFWLCLSLACAQAGALRVVVADFEEPRLPRLGGAAVHPASKVRLSRDGPFEGKQFAELAYRFEAARGLQYLEVFAPKLFATRVRRIAVAVRGDGAGCTVRVRFSDRGGEWHQFDLGTLDFKGWRVLEADLGGGRDTWGGDGNHKLDYPVTFQNVVLDATTRPAQGAIGLDAITVDTQPDAEKLVDSRFVPTQPHGYFWGKDHPPGGSLVLRAAVPRDVDALVRARLLDHRGEPVADLWRGRVHLERGKPMTRGLRIKVERFGVYFVEVTAGDHTQRHSFGWLPEPAPVWPDGPFGACTHFAQHKHRLPLTLELLRRMGAAWLRDELSWGGVEREKGTFGFPPYYDRYMTTAGDLGLRPLIIFDYGNRHYDKGMAPVSAEAVAAFVRYCTTLMGRYRRVCRHWEVWNEPNIFFWKPKPNVGDYTKLLRAVYPAAKKAHPEATIVGVCTAGTNLKFVEGVLERGGGKFMDAISVHPYRYPRSPEESDFLGEMARLKALLDKHDAGHLKVWLTELGYPTHVGNRGLPQHRSAAYLVRLMLQALSLPFIERLFVYDFQDDGTTPHYNEHNFGLIRLDHSPKVGYAAHCTTARLLHRKRFRRSLAAGDHIVCYEFAGDTGTVLAAWATKPAATLALRVSGKAPSVTDLMGNQAPVDAGDGRLDLPLTAEPLFITGYGDAAPRPEPPKRKRSSN